MDDAPSVWVYHYNYWDPKTNTLTQATRAATLESIKNGLGIPVLESGRKIPASRVDWQGRELEPGTSLPPRDAASIASDKPRQRK